MDASRAFFSSLSRRERTLFGRSNPDRKGSMLHDYMQECDKAHRRELDDALEEIENFGSTVASFPVNTATSAVTNSPWKPTGAVQRSDGCSHQLPASGFGRQDRSAASSDQSTNTTVVAGSPCRPLTSPSGRSCRHHP